MANKRKDNGGIIVQAGILAAASIIVRIIGLLYRSPLTAIIGDTGNGYYSTAYNIYTIILLVSSYSIPSALSKLMSQKIAVGEYKNAERAFHAALIYAVIVGLIGSMILFFGAGALVTPHAVPVLRVFAPTIFFFAILGVLRGYFQANQTMVETSISQIIEQAMNAVVSIGAAWFLIRISQGADEDTVAVRGAMGSAMGTGAGVGIALIFMFIMFLRTRSYYGGRLKEDRTGKIDPMGQVMKTTVAVITPFILSGFIMNLTTVVNQTIYTRIMTGFFHNAENDVVTMYGLFSSKAVVITNIPISIATAVAAAIIPNISTAYAQKDIKETRRRSVNAIRLTFIVAMPCAMGLCVLARPITMLLFPQMDTLNTASMLLATLAVTVVFYSISTITNAVLQSIGRMLKPLVSAGIALATQTVVLVLMLLFTPFRGVQLSGYALVVSSILYSLMIFIINNRYLRRYLRMRINRKNVWGKPIMASVFMGIISFAVYEVLYLLLRGHIRLYFANFIAVLPAILVAIVVYFYVLIRIRGLSEKDLLAMPKGTGIVRALKKMKWM